MDICTLVVPTMVTAMGCLPGPTICRPVADLAAHTVREFCEQEPARDCNGTLPHYECVREDKTTYILRWNLQP
jgi:hypothetical protein